jgi:hypothetical protein
MPASSNEKPPATIPQSDAQSRSSVTLQPHPALTRCFHARTRNAIKSRGAAIPQQRKPGTVSQPNAYSPLRSVGGPVRDDSHSFQRTGPSAPS